MATRVRSLVAISYLSGLVRIPHFSQSELIQSLQEDF
jgi:hypothetical protein